MTRTLIYIVAVAAAIVAAMWLADRPGAVTLTWRGWRADTSVGFLVLVVAAIAAAAAALYRGWLALRRAPQAYLASRRLARREKGYRSLTQGMVAVAAGDPDEALRQAKRADSMLGDPPLTMLLSAQAAQLNGDEAAAKSYFTAMLDRPETAFLGLRGLLIQAQRDADQPTALSLARRAYELRPKTPWVLTTLFDLQVKEGRWRDALATLEEAIRRHAFGGEEGRFRKVAVLLGCSGEAEQAGETVEALAYARKAHQQAPEMLPATIRLVTLMIAAGRKRPATRIIHNAWTHRPHPDLARIYGAMEESDALKQVNRFERLLAFNADHAESHIALAEAALEAKLWGTARSHLTTAAGSAPPTRICRLMAELEEQEHGDNAAVRKWLLRAASAETDAAWTCSGCGNVADRWAPLCTKCQSLGTLEWRAPARARGLVFRTPGDGPDDTPGEEPPSPEKAPAPAINAARTDTAVAPSKDLDPPVIDGPLHRE